MAGVQFEVRHHFDQPPRVVWDEMIDWSGHANWIPATRVRIESEDPTAVGARFTAWTGVGKLSLEDRMEVAALDWDDTEPRGHCEVIKHGPVLRGRAGFTIVSDGGTGTDLEWFEDVTVPYLPGFLSPVVAKVAALGFSQGMKSLAKLLDRQAA
jgi:hypothetical protein